MQYFARLLACLCFAALLASAVPAAEIERSSPASSIPDTKDASEYWDFIASLESGHVVLARFSVTNVGPGKHTAYVIGHVVFPDGRSVQFEKARKKGKWFLSEDGLHIAIGSNELQQSGGLHNLKINRSKILIDLHFTPGILRGTAREPVDKSYWVNLLHTSAPVEGTLFVPGMKAPIDVRGSIAGTHTWMRKSEPKLNLRRVEFFSLPDRGGEKGDEREDTTLYFSDFTSPKGARSSWLVLARDGKIVYQTDRFEVDLQGDFGAKLGKRYPVPARFVVKGPDLEGEIELSRVLTKDKPLDIIPQPFRFLLSFATNLDPRRAWAVSSFRVRLRERSDEPIVELSGTGVAAVMYTKPFPRGM